MKKGLIIGIIVLLILLPVSYYLISPVWRNVEVDEESPIVKDNMDKMSDLEMEQFKKEVEELKDDVMEMEDAMPNEVKVLTEGEFKPRAHEVEGKALLIQDGDSKIIRFENFETVNGPNLHIYLSTTLGDEDFVDLGEMKATKGNVNYEIPKDVDTDKYNKVLVWCVPFRVLFSYAELN